MHDDEHFLCDTRLSIVVDGDDMLCIHDDGGYGNVVTTEFEPFEKYL